MLSFLGNCSFNKLFHTCETTEGNFLQHRLPQFGIAPMSSPELGENNGRVYSVHANLRDEIDVMDVMYAGAGLELINR